MMGRQPDTQQKLFISLSFLILTNINSFKGNKMNTFLKKISTTILILYILFLSGNIALGEEKPKDKKDRTKQVNRGRQRRDRARNIDKDRNPDSERKNRLKRRERQQKQEREGNSAEKAKGKTDNDKSKGKGKNKQTAEQEAAGDALKKVKNVVE